MRVFSRIALTIVAIFLVPPALFAVDLSADCPLQLVASTAPPTPFFQSPHGAFRFGNLVFVVRGQVLNTYTVNDLGDITNNPPRQDFLGNLGARESEGGVTFANGFIYVSSEAGLEIFDLRNTKPGGSAPTLVSRTPNLHYRRLAISNGILAALYPSTDYPCLVGGPTPNCFNSIDLYNVSNPSAPQLVGSIPSQTSPIGGFNDVAFNYGYLVTTGQTGTVVYSINNPSAPAFAFAVGTPGTFLVSNTTDLLAVGNDTSILTYGVSANSGALSPMFLHTVATLRLEHSNPIMFHPQATFDEAGSRLITMVDELDPQTLQPARTFAFDVFDYSIPMFEGTDPRVYEQVSYTTGDEVKWNPTAVGPYVYVVGELTGVQEYGVCGQMTGRIETTTLASLPCPTTTGGPTVAELHGWVTGATRIANVELFLDGNSLGSGALTNDVARTDIPSTTPVQNWRVVVSLPANLGGTAQPGRVHLLTAVGTDINGNRRQFASQSFFFTPNWQTSCVARRRAAQ
ncbi:MAG TPA: hypothetical protein VL284_04110 [Thermoanaerobaculia bacterium]|nr:hypothetical protein [Thermoanaerobaculia bacterium]